MGRERILIDTTLLIDHLRKKNKDATVFFKTAEKFDCCISSVTEFEFIVGRNEKNRFFVDTLLKHLPILPFDSSCVAIASEIYIELKSKNHLIPAPDIFIAATAINNEMQLATLNQGHFSRIKHLRLVPI